MLKYRTSNEDLIKQKQKEWREANRDSERLRHKLWRSKNHSYDLQRRRDYRRRIKKKYNIPDRYGGKRQAYVRGLAEEFFGMKAQEEVRFNWLRSTKGFVMAVDIFFSELNLIIEYNGQQHYMPVKFGSSMEEAKRKFEEQIVRDNFKYKSILSRGIKLLVIPYTFSKSDIISLLSKIKKGE